MLKKEMMSPSLETQCNQNPVSQDYTTVIASSVLQVQFYARLGSDHFHGNL